MPVSVRLRDRSYNQSLIDNFLSAAEPLTEEEREEKAALVEQVFTNWNKPELRKFLELSGRYGRTAHAAIAAEMDNKTEEDLEAYAEVYWKRYKEIPGEARRRRCCG
jgi:SWI/SNF-related matrix-associated actin-dependent regulator of chromatin subfamily A member 5